MRIAIVTPAPPRSRKGNRVTAERWARLIKGLGHRARIDEEYHGQKCDVLVALHARRSATSIARFARSRPDAPLVVALTGTDLYQDLKRSAPARDSLRRATRLIALHGAAADDLPANARHKLRVIYQSVVPRKVKPPPLKRVFEVCVLGHLRDVKDPFRAAMAARRLPADSRIRIMHIGGALSEKMASRARAESKRNGRYRWLGELPRGQAVRRLARSRLLVMSSKLEGGPNAISEAIVNRVPVIASQISGHVGMLGTDYPGYFPVGDTAALADAMCRAESDRAFYSALNRACRRRASLFTPRREARSWRELLAEFDV